MGEKRKKEKKEEEKGHLKNKGAKKREAHDKNENVSRHFYSQ